MRIVPLAGRDDELAEALALLDGVHERGEALVVRGEPGIGKTRLPFSGAA